MKRTVVVLSMLLLLAASFPAPAQAGGLIDQVCMSIQHQKGVSHATALIRCTVHTTSVVTKTAGGRGLASTSPEAVWTWTADDKLWQIRVTAYYHATTDGTSSQSNKLFWTFDSVTCFRDHAYIVTVTIDGCPANGYVYYRTDNGLRSVYGGAYYTVSDQGSAFGIAGTVAEGYQSVLWLPSCYPNTSDIGNCLPIGPHTGKP